MHVTKHHGLANDFLVALLDELPPDGPDLARRWCDRRTGIGADGLIFGTPSPNHDLVMTLFNADGSMAEISGNGIRCLAQAEARRQSTDQLDIEIETGAGLRQLVVSAGADPAMALVRVDMGVVGDGPALPDTLPTANYQVIQAATADIGNPHVVLHVETLDSVDVAINGPELEALWMPGGINVHFLTVTGTDEITLQHWERGAGVTAACGSGATVSAYLAHGWGLVGGNVHVVMPGGAASVELGDHATLVGPAVHIADIEVAEPGELRG